MSVHQEARSGEAATGTHQEPLTLHPGGRLAVAGARAVTLTRGGYALIDLLLVYQARGWALSCLGARAALGLGAAALAQRVSRLNRALAPLGRRVVCRGGRLAVVRGKRR